MVALNKFWSFGCFLSLYDEYSEKHGKWNVHSVNEDNQNKVKIEEYKNAYT
ncbi:hypothetical protein [Methanosarcina siciliae]|uniref:hypothetical protein n=1 Tax=Methanosarcina siciliae TaxID=38027 RepID=UPI000ADE46EA|nr:hypothetical protein [Methanosarcina siciliae]